MVWLTVICPEVHTTSCDLPEFLSLGSLWALSLNISWHLVQLFATTKRLKLERTHSRLISNCCNNTKHEASQIFWTLPGRSWIFWKSKLLHGLRVLEHFRLEHFMFLGSMSERTALWANQKLRQTAFGPKPFIHQVGKQLDVFGFVKFRGDSGLISCMLYVCLLKKKHTSPAAIGIWFSNLLILFSPCSLGRASHHIAYVHLPAHRSVDRFQADISMVYLK